MRNVEALRHPERRTTPAAARSPGYSLLSVLAIGAAACVPTDPGTVGPPPGTAHVSGRIRDAVGQDVEGVSVRVPGPRGYYGVNTDSKGRYAMNVPVAEFEGLTPVAVFAVKDGFRPFYAWYTRLEEGLSYNFSTTDQRPLTDLEVGEFAPPGLATLLHMGDEVFGGPVNSRLQVASSGTDLVYRITTWTPELDAISGSVAVTFSARGLESSECPGNAIVVITETGAATWATPHDSDPSGDFSGYGLILALPAIQPGEDIYLRVISGSCPVSGDQGDDYEIAGVVVRFDP